MAGAGKPSASPGRRQVALGRPGRGAELLVRGTEQPGVARCGEARTRASLPWRLPTCTRWISCGSYPGLTAISTASGTARRAAGPEPAPST
jgi:hypothetical protein